MNILFLGGFYPFYHFTRLPIPGKHDHDGDLASAAFVFPIVGLIVGALLALVWWITSLALPPALASGLTIAAGLLLTGALHEDGFSDCADGLGGGHSKERALEIMRDSRIGAYGAAALIVTIGLRWFALAEFDIIAGIAALLIAHMASRTSIIIALATSNYARDKGLGSSVASGSTLQTWIIASIVCLLLGVVIGGAAAIVACLLAFLISWLFLKYLENRLGGYTGDGLGAMQQISEIVVLLTLTGFWVV